MNKNIILIHGWGAKTLKLKKLEIELKKRGWSVLLPELPGFETKPPRTPWTLKDYVKYILELSYKKWGSEKIYIFGHSFGGRVAIKMALENNEKLSGIILCSAGGISRSYYLVRMFFYILAKTGKMFLVAPGLAKYWRKFIYKIAGEHDYEKTEGVMRETFKNIISEELKGPVKKVNTRILILWGRLDKVTPVSDAYYLKRVVSKARLKVFNKDGHKLPYRNPNGVANEIEKWHRSIR